MGSLKSRIAVVIVNYRKAARVSECLAALRRQTVAANLSIMIVDNSEDAGQAQLLQQSVEPGEHLHVTPTNLGYTKGVNLAVSLSEPAEYLLIVSPDIIVDDQNCIEKMLHHIESRPDIGVLSVRQINDDGSQVEVARNYPSLLDQVARRILSTPSRDRALLTAVYAPDAPADIYTDWVQSSFMLIRRSDWDAVGYLDERYFLFMADIEICRRIQNRGKKISVYTEVQVRADGIRASRGGWMTIFTTKAQRYHVKDALVYYLTRSPLRAPPAGNAMASNAN